MEEADARGGGDAPARLLELARAVASDLRRHRADVHTSAIAFRVLVSLVPLTLLAVALLGSLGLADVWTDSVYPTLADRLSPPVSAAADYVVEQIFATPSGGLIAFSAALFLWHTGRGVRAAQRALDDVHETRDRRPARRELLVVGALTLAVDACFLSALGAVVVLGRSGSTVLALARWPAAAVLLAVGVALLVRYAPAERPDPRWATAGSAFVVAGWLVASAAFGVWTTSVASYRSAVGNLAAFLVLTTYCLVMSAIFVAGAQLDETLRRRVGGGARGA